MTIVENARVVVGDAETRYEIKYVHGSIVQIHYKTVDRENFEIFIECISEVKQNENTD